MFYMIAYDIPDNKRRAKISKILEGYGIRVQFSVFECILNQNIYEELCDKLNRVLCQNEDSIRIYRMCESCKKNISIKGIGEVYEVKDLVFI